MTFFDLWINDGVLLYINLLYNLMNDLFYLLGSDRFVGRHEGEGKSQDRC